MKAPPLAASTATIRVFWQPGCTSCLAAKQFLARHGIAFESINVREHAGAMEMLASLGARSVPVVSRGAQWTYAQELRELAAFLGLTLERQTLALPQLIERVEALLASVQTSTLQLPRSMWEQGVAGRDDRTAIDIPFHIAQIVAGFLDAADGGELTYEHFERRPQGSARSSTAVAGELSAVHTRFSAWRVKSYKTTATSSVQTYYGSQPLSGVLERSAWHIAQHARQLEHLLVAGGVQPSSPLGDKALAGLPLPHGVWDAEVGRDG